jgi:hypothetical protein
MTGGFREHRAGCPTEPELRRALGCDEDAPRIVFTLGGIHHRRCPLSVLDEQIWGFLSYFSHYQTGLLPEAGGIADQPAVFLLAAAYLNNEIARLKDERTDT